MRDAPRPRSPLSSASFVRPSMNCCRARFVRRTGTSTRPCTAMARSIEAGATSGCPACVSRKARLLIHVLAMAVWPRPICSSSRNPSRSACRPRPRSPSRAVLQARPSCISRNSARWPGRGVPINCNASRYWSTAASGGAPDGMVRRERAARQPTSSVGSACALRSTGKTVPYTASAAAAEGVMARFDARTQSASARKPTASGPAAAVAWRALSSTATMRSGSSMPLYKSARPSSSRACTKGASLNCCKA